MIIFITFTLMLTSSANENFPRITCKRPKLLLHQFKMERQNLLLLSTSASSTSSSIITLQSQKLKQMNDFLDAIEYSETDEEWNSSLSLGIDMLLRAVKTVSFASPLKDKLLVKLYKYKLKLILIRKPIDLRELEDCFNNCTENKSIDAFEEYFGLYPELDALLADKVLEYSVNFSLHDKVKFCLDMKRRGGRENICKELMTVIFKDVKAAKECEIQSNTVLLLLDLIKIYMEAVSDTSYDISDMIVSVYSCNRKEFLENSRIFDKFIEILQVCLKLPDSPNSLVTMLNSKIRSYLSRPEAKDDRIIQSCLKFVLELVDLNIGCINQFADFLLKFQLMKLGNCSRPTRNLMYKLFSKHSIVYPSAFLENLSSTELKYEFVNYVLGSKKSSGSYLISIFTDYNDEKYIEILEKYLKLFVDPDIFKEGKFSEFDMFDDDLFIQVDSEELELVAIPDESLLAFFKDVLLPNYMKTFRSKNNDVFNSKLPRLIAIICHLLLNGGKITWTELSPTFGLNAATSASDWMTRSIYCKIYLTFVKLIGKSTSQSVLKNILNPVNAAEFWIKCLLDFKQYDQVDFFEQYYQCTMNDRLDCFKRKQGVHYILYIYLIHFLCISIHFYFSAYVLVINAPANFTFRLVLNTVDFKSQISTDWWNYLLKLGGYLIEASSFDLHGKVCALLAKYLPLNDFDLIVSFYKMTWKGIKKVSWEEFKKNRRDLMLKHFEMNDNISNLIKFIKSGEYTYGIFISIYSEFIDGFMRNEGTAFLIRLALISVSRSIIKDTNTLEMLSESLIRRNNTDYMGLYRNLVLLTELKMIPDNANALLRELCGECGLECPEELIKILSKHPSDSKVRVNNIFDNMSAAPVTQTILFKEPIFMLSTQPTAFNCLTQLMKLLWVTESKDQCNELRCFVEYLRKQKGRRDEYFNLLFIE